MTSEDTTYIEIADNKLDKIIDNAANERTKIENRDTRESENAKTTRTKYMLGAVAGVALAGAAVLSGAALPAMSYAVMYVLIAGVGGGTLISMTAFTAALNVKLNMKHDDINAEINTIETTKGKIL